MTRSRVAETVLGLAVAAAIAAVSFVVRHHQVTRGGSLPAGRSAAGAATDDLPDVTLTDATLDLGDVRILVSVRPRPLVAFAPNRFRFRAESGGTPVALAGAAVSFTMAMPMGDHRHALVGTADGWHEAEAALPLCPSGQRRWYGTLDFTLAGGARSARFAFDLAPPAPPGDGAAASRP